MIEPFAVIIIQTDTPAPRQRSQRHNPVRPRPKYYRLRRRTPRSSTHHRHCRVLY